MKKKQKKQDLTQVLQKLDSVISQHKMMIEKQNKLSRQESANLKEEKKIETLEEKNVDEMEKLEALEKEVKQTLKGTPLQRITFRDIAKGSIGALVGIIVHNTIIYGYEFGSSIDNIRAAILLVVSFAVAVILIYATGFRKINDPSIKYILPLRALTVFAVALIMVAFVFALFHSEFGHDIGLTFRQISAGSLSATVGAATADLLGRE